MALYLIPTFLSENTNVLPNEVLNIAASLDEFVVENEKSARQFLKSINTKIKQNDFVFHLLNEHSTPKEISSLLEILKKKKDIGLLSEAGCPAVADPGASLVRLAHENNIKVIPLTGPSSILLALMASGMNGQSFVFHGYLPRESTLRRNKLLELEKDAMKKSQTQIFIEAPYRNQQLLADILQTLNENTLLCISCDLTSKDEFINTMSVKEWKKQIPRINKKPVIFLIGK
jgi:16S rRNA (cytidine1402-2'-O)-methyltransferase